MDKNELLDLVNKISKGYDMEYTDIYISKDKLNIKDIKTLMGQEVFDMDLNNKGWLIFINPCNIANWAHKCTYIFVVDKITLFKNKEAYLPPLDNIEIEELDKELIKN